MNIVKPVIEDKDMERMMGNLLRYGVVLSAVIILTGAVFYMFQHGHESPHYRHFTGEPKQFIQLKEIVQTALQGRGRSIIQFGLLLLIATPIARIIFSIVGYILEKDYLYIGITAIVLGIILYNF